MESIAQVARTPGSRLTVRQSEAQLSNGEFTALATLVDQMAAAYPHQELGESLPILLRGYEMLAIEFGLRRVRDALEMLLTSRKFFPHPAELREAIEAVKETERRQILADNPWTPCEQCSAHVPGMIPVNADGSRWTFSRERVRPAAYRVCQCKTEWRRRVQELLGEAPQPQRSIADGKARAAGE